MMRTVMVVVRAEMGVEKWYVEGAGEMGMRKGMEGREMVKSMGEAVVMETGMETVTAMETVATATEMEMVETVMETEEMAMGTATVTAMETVAMATEMEMVETGMVQMETEMSMSTTTEADTVAVETVVEKKTAPMKSAMEMVLVMEAERATVTASAYRSA